MHSTYSHSLTLFTKKKSNTYVNQLKKTFSDASPPYTTSKEQSFLVESISTVFVNHFSTLFSNFHMYTIRDLTDPEKPITVFMKESFLYDMPDSSFFSPFLSSQIFFDYSDKRLRKRDKEGNHSSCEFGYVETISHLYYDRLTYRKKIECIIDQVLVNEITLRFLFERKL